MDNYATGNSMLNLNQLGTTTISGKILLIRIVFNKKGASSNTVTLTQLGAGEDTKQIGVIDTTDKLTNMDYGVPCNNGLKIVCATGTAPDMTVVYRVQP